jgi:hypothetical protein
LRRAARQQAGEADFVLTETVGFETLPRMRNICFVLTIAAALLPDLLLAESRRGSKAERARKFSRNEVEQNWAREYGYIPLDSGRAAAESDERSSFDDPEEMEQRRPARKPRRHTQQEHDEWTGELARWPGVTLYR